MFCIFVREASAGPSLSLTTGPRLGRGAQPGEGFTHDVALSMRAAKSGWLWLTPCDGAGGAGSETGALALTMEADCWVLSKRRAASCGVWDMARSMRAACGVRSEAMVGGLD